MKLTRRIGAAAVLALAGAATGDPTFQTIALSGMQAPGLPAGVTFSFLADARINTAGKVAFWADLAGPGITAANSNTIWTASSGTLAPVLRQGDPSPIAPNLVWGAIPGVSLATSGRLGFTASLLNTTTPGITTLGIFTSDPAPGAVTPIAVEGNPAPGLPAGTNYSLFTGAGASPAGPLAYAANAGRGVWIGAAGGDPIIQAARGQQAPGAPAGITFDYLESPVMGSAGAAVFRASTTDGATTPTLGWGLWQTTAAAPAPIAISGTQVPGLPAGVVFAEFSLQPSVSGSSKLAIWARVIGPGVNPLNDGLIYAYTNAPGPAIVARAGDQAPGAPSGIAFGKLGRHPVISASGHVAFYSLLTNFGAPAGAGVWLQAPNQPLMPIAITGQQAPRLPAGVTFAGFTEPTLSDSGQIAFLARLAGTGVTPSTGWVLYASDSMGRLYPVVRTGDLFDVGSGPARVVDEVIFDSPGPESGVSAFAGVGPSSLLTFKLIFRDPALPPSTALSSGIFTASIRCLPDLSNNGSIAVDDFILFLNGFAAENLRACDFSGNGLLGVDDFIYFLNAVAVGCR